MSTFSAMVALKGILGALDQPVTRRLRKENPIFNGDMCVIEHFAREAITDTQSVEITDADITNAYNILIRTDSGYDFVKWRALIGPIELRLGIRDVLESFARQAKGVQS